MSSPVLIEHLDSAIDALLNESGGTIPDVEVQVAELLGVAAELRTLPRPDFRSQLKFELMESAYAASGMVQPELRVLDAVAARPQVRKPIRPTEEQILPTLFGCGYGAYGVRRSNFAISALAHAFALMLVVTSGLWMAHQGTVAQVKTILITDDVSEYLPATKTPLTMRGGGGGGDREKVRAPQGRLPKSAMQQITPPEVVRRNENPMLAEEPTVVVPPQVNLANNRMPNLGDPTSRVIGPPSNGTGAGAGIGDGSNHGIGSGRGPGVGTGIGGGYGGEIFSVGGGVSAPRAIYQPEPEYSSEARQAKYQGTVVLSLVVGTDGNAHDVQVAHSLGLGLDEKAIEAVQQWRFEPAMKDGRPVAVGVAVQVNFRLF